MSYCSSTWYHSILYAMHNTKWYLAVPSLWGAYGITLQGSRFFAWASRLLLGQPSESRVLDRGYVICRQAIIAAQGIEEPEKTPRFRYILHASNELRKRKKKSLRRLRRLPRGWRRGMRGNWVLGSRLKEVEEVKSRGLTGPSMMKGPCGVGIQSRGG